MHARDKVAHPVQIQTVDLKRKIAFNFEPTMLELEQGNVDANKIKFMLQLTAKFL